MQSEQRAYYVERFLVSNALVVHHFIEQVWIGVVMGHGPNAFFTI
jgi:hypothetical protein